MSERNSEHITQGKALGSLRITMEVAYVAYSQCDWAAGLLSLVYVKCDENRFEPKRVVCKLLLRIDDPQPLHRMSRGR